MKICKRTRPTRSKFTYFGRITDVHYAVLEAPPAPHSGPLDGPVKGAELWKVKAVLKGLPPASKTQFFSQPKQLLGGLTPLQALKAGRFEKVMRLAAAFSEAPPRASIREFLLANARPTSTEDLIANLKRRYPQLRIGPGTKAFPERVGKKP